jgi:CO/xanthine dehydrogenase Mo-binding subunit
MTIDDFSIVGKRYPRIDAPDKVRGRTKYLDDLKFPGIL